MKDEGKLPLDIVARLAHLGVLNMRIYRKLARNEAALSWLAEPTTAADVARASGGANPPVSAKFRPAAKAKGAAA